MLRASLSLQSDEELDQYIRETLHSGNALVGTCAMGLAPEKGAVVDANMKVYGVQGLRVADSSVIPVIPGISFQRCSGLYVSQGNQQQHIESAE